MSSNNLSWNAVIRKAAKNLDIEISRMVRRIALFIITSAIKRTPVDEGDLRRAWNISLNYPNPVTNPGESGKHTIGPITGLFPIVHITNGLPYAIVAEYGLWPGPGPKTTSGTNPKTGQGIFSRKAPQGMLEISILNLMRNISEIAHGRG